MTKAEQEDVAKALTVPLPGGVRLTDEEHELRCGRDLGHGRAVIVARSILTKVRNASLGEGS